VGLGAIGVSLRLATVQIDFRHQSRLEIATIEVDLQY
jgi:hypothetical protein